MIKSKSKNQWGSFVTNKPVGTPPQYETVNLNEVLLRSNAIIIFHKNTQYKKIKFSKYSNIKAIVDPFKIVDKKNLNIKKQKYFNL